MNEQNIIKANDLLRTLNYHRKTLSELQACKNYEVSISNACSPNNSVITSYHIPDADAKKFVDIKIAGLKQKIKEIEKEIEAL